MLDPWWVFTAPTLKTSRPFCDGRPAQRSGQISVRLALIQEWNYIETSSRIDSLDG